MKKGEISPWSFYRHQSTSEQLPMVTQAQPQPQKKTTPLNKFQKLHYKRIAQLSLLSSQPAHQRQALRKQHSASLEPYCPIVDSPIINTSHELVATRDDTTELYNRHVLLVAVLEILRTESRDKQKEGPRVRDKYECLFPILKPREGLRNRNAQLVRESPSHMLFHQLFSNSPHFL